MYLTFPYPEIYPVDIPDKNITAFLKPKETEHTEKSEEEVIKDGLRNPIGSPPISQIVKKGQKILILVDDYTRSTPTNTILPQVINKLRAAGISHNNITLLIASGTHRKMTLQEKIKKYGSSIVTNYPIKDHLWNNAREIVQLPKTRNGTEIWVNKALLNADFIIGVGHIVPHRVSGFSGGCKIVQPGVCGAVTTGQTHWLSALFDGPEIMGKIDNPVREEINEVGIKAGLKFIVNPVLDGEGHMVHCLCGAPVEAHREGCRRAMEVFGAHLSEKADIVIADSYPADMELWQASKGIYSADLALKPGGVIMLVTPCPEGISSEHPKIMEFGYRPFKQIEEKVKRKEINDLTLAAHLVHVGKVIKEKGSCIIVSPNINKKTAEKIGLMWEDNPEKALEKAISIKGEKASIAVIKNGGETMPLLPF